MAGPDDDDFDDGYDEEDDELADCGWVPGEGCMLAGTEYCDFECPYRSDLDNDE